MSAITKGIEFTVPAIPVAQPRQRSVAFAGRIRTYTPTKHPVNDFKASVRLVAAQAWSGAPLDGPLSVAIAFVLPRPKAKIRKRGDNPRYWHTGRPDFDNLAKSLTDALTGLLWRDDSQLAMVAITKQVAAADEQPCVGVKVEPL